MTKHFRNVDNYQIVEISSIMHNAYIVSRDKDGNILYINNYIDKDQFNQL